MSSWWLLVATARAMTLEEAWSAAAEHDPQLQIARETAAQQATIRGKAWSALSPRLDLNASYVLNNKEIAVDFTEGLPDSLMQFIDPKDLPPPIVVQEKDFWQGDLTVSDRLFSASSFSALRASYQLDDAAQEDLRQAEISSKTRVAQAYYGQLTAEGAVGVAEQGLELARAQLELARRSKEAGLADDRAVIQGQLGVSRAERDVAKAREGLLAAQTGFELVVGVPGTGLVLPEPVDVPTDLDAALAEARSTRPDLLAADHRVRALRATHVAQDLRWLPVIDGQGQYLYSQNLGFNDTHWNWRIVVAASWNLWDGGLRVAESRETASQLHQAEVGEQLAVDSAEREIRLAFEAHARAQAALDSVENEIALANQSLQLAERSYAAGGLTWLEVEQARLAVQAAELSRLQERMNRDLAAIDLLARTGRL
jgi:outer membrane protein